MSVVPAGEAVELLNSKSIVAIPTETVYGLAGRIDFPEAIENIFATKQRPSFDPLIVHVADIQQAKACVSDWNPALQVLATDFWPGPLTLIAPKAPHISDVITAGLDTVALRCPNHEVALQILKKMDQPVAAPSANMFSKTSPTSAAHVESEFHGRVPVVDGGPCQVGLESTICRITSIDESQQYCEVQVLRRGAVLPSDIQRKLNAKGWKVTLIPAEKNVIAPGQLKIHYRPAIPLVLVKDNSLSDKDIVNKVGHQVDVQNIQWLKLNESPALAARTLYSQLRELGQAPATVLICRWSKNWTGEFWQSIEDRLSRASQIVL